MTQYIWTIYESIWRQPDWLEQWEVCNCWSLLIFVDAGKQSLRKTFHRSYAPRRRTVDRSWLSMSPMLTTLWAKCTSVSVISVISPRSIWDLLGEMTRFCFVLSRGEDTDWAGHCGGHPAYHDRPYLHARAGGQCTQEQGRAASTWCRAHPAALARRSREHSPCREARVSHWGDCNCGMHRVGHNTLQHNFILEICPMLNQDFIEY